MASGQRVIAVAERYVGVAEATGRNDGPQIETWQRAAEDSLGLPRGTYRGAPWCAIFVRAVYAEAGVPLDSMLGHPFTGFICQRADAMGGLAPDGLAPPGSLLIRCGIHVGLVVRDRGNGLIDTIEGNVGNAVRRLVRARDEWRVIVPPAVAGTITRVAMRDSYGFDDLNLRPRLFGGWATAKVRDARMEAFAAARPDMWTRAVRINRPSPFAFEAGPIGTHGATWQFGGWASREVREERLAAYARRVGHMNLRRWRRRVPVSSEGGTATAAGALSTR